MTNTRDDLQAQPDGDPRLTAYALGELDGPESAAERAEVEALLARDAEARAEAAAVREMAGTLRDEFATQATGEAVPALTPAQRSAIERAARGPASTGALRAWLWPAMAAALLVVVAVWQLADRRYNFLLSRPASDGIVVGVDDSRVPASDGAARRLAEPLGQLPLDAPPSLADAVVSEAETVDALELTPEMMSMLSSLGYGGGSGGAAAPGPAAAAPSSSPSLTGRGRPQLKALGYLGEVARDEFDAVVMHHEAADDRAAPRLRYLRVAPRASGTELYVPIVEQGFQSPWTAPFSTFGVDVDSAAYSNVRRFLNNGQLPPVDAVRLEELLNYFRYDDSAPAPGAEQPFTVTVDVTDCPWSPGRRLARVALKGREVPVAQRTSSNLVFLLDVSGSMSDQDKLPLLVASMKLLTQQLDERDRVAIVTYAGAAGLVLDSTVCDGAGRQRVLDALDRLSAGGSTAGAAGIQLAYQVAASHFRHGGTNRVILATDGDFNVGITDRTQLQGLIEQSARSGVFLTVLGFGEGNLKDGTAELLADKGNGQYCYIDSLDEGRRVLVQQMAGTLLTIAKDVKLQVEFNPAQVEAYRLIGYENRALAAQDFKDDRKDAGDIGAGHSVVALYELVPPGAGAPGTDPPRYQKPADAPRPELVPSDELLTVKLRWKEPDGATSTETQVPVRDGGGTLATARADVKFSAAVAAFGLLLRGSEHVRTDRGWLWEQVIALAEAGRGADPDGWRAEFVRLSKAARDIQGAGPNPR